MNASNIVCLNLLHMVEIVILHTIHTRDGDIEDVTTIQHHSDHIQTVISQ